MSPHRHRWLLGAVRPWGILRYARIEYRCDCGARRTEKTTSPLVVDTARYIQAKEVVR